MPDSLIGALYAVPPGDDQRPIFGRSNPATGSSAAVQVTASWQNLQGLPYVGLFSVQMNGGAAQYPIKWALRLFDPDTILYSWLGGGEFVSTEAAAINTAYLSERILVPPRWYVGVVGRFNAGAAANTVALYSVGFYIPRGNLSLP